MSIGMRSRQEVEQAANDERARQRDQHVGAFVLGVLAILILIGLAVDAFIRPAYWIAGMP